MKSVLQSPNPRLLRNPRYITVAEKHMYTKMCAMVLRVRLFARLRFMCMTPNVKFLLYISVSTPSIVTMTIVTVPMVL